MRADESRSAEGTFHLEGHGFVTARNDPREAVWVSFVPERSSADGATSLGAVNPAMRTLIDSGVLRARLVRDGVVLDVRLIRTERADPSRTGLESPL